MSHISLENKGIRATFATDAHQKPYIEFLDPSYARASLILLDIEQKTMHAVLHEGVFLISETPQEFFDAVLASEEIELHADLYCGDHIALRAPVKTMNGQVGRTTEVVTGDIVNINGCDYPTFSAGGFAMTPLA
tara:strand:- start:2905 stop:3306 length:402 start_codon:yes stop_codon:yes gene_type:complete